MSISSLQNTQFLPIYESVQGSLSVGYHCLSHGHGHLLCRVTNGEERKPPEYKSDRADEHKEEQKGERESERHRERGRLQALVRERETVN